MACGLAGEAGAVCNERVGFGGWGLSVDRQLDSLAILRHLKYPPVETGPVPLPLDGKKLPRHSQLWLNPPGSTPFKNLFHVVVHSPCAQDTLLSCDVGKVSEEYAVSRSGRFYRLDPQTLADTLGRPVTWDDLTRYLELGFKIKTPESGKAFRKEMDSLGIRIDRVFEDMDTLDRDPWFGIFYRSVCNKTFLYGVKYQVKGDSVRHLGTRVYYRFNLPYLSTKILGGQSAVYIMDSLAIPNMPRIKELLNTHKD